MLEQMKELKQHCEGDRDINKQILEDQRKRAEHSVNTAAQLSAQLLEKVRHLCGTTKTMLSDLVLLSFVLFLIVFTNFNFFYLLIYYGF